MTLTLADIKAARERIRRHIIRTPLIEARAAGALTGARILVKAEVLQRTGSFKFRGAINRLMQLTADERKKGVVAFSSGNHAQAIAAASREVGTPAVIVMPADAPALKINNTKNYGAEVILYDRQTEDRVAIGKKLAAERGLVLVPPFDDDAVMAGQGTAGIELYEDAGTQLDAVLIPCSGGGLAAGIGTALAALSPETKIYPVEPVQFDDMTRSLATGERLANTPGQSSLCDALLVDLPGERTFPILRSLGAQGITVTDDEALRAMTYAFYELKLVAEPGGAVALAAALSGKLDIKGKTIAVILSGGNVDAGVFTRALSLT